MILFFTRLFCQLVLREIRSLFQASLSKKVTDDIRYYHFLTTLLLLLKNTMANIDILERRLPEDGVHFFVERKRDADLMIRALEHDIACLHGSKSEQYPDPDIHDEIASFAQLDSIIARRHPILSSYGVELSSLSLIRKTASLSTGFPEASRFIRYIQKNKQRDTKDILTALKNLSRRKEDHPLFFATLHIFFLLHDMIYLKTYYRK